MDATNETPSQKQARIRRERRQAKIAAGGSDRLAAITGIQGRKIPEPESSTTTTSTTSTPKSASISNVNEEYDDPDHMDLAEHFGPPSQSSFSTRPPSNLSQFQPQPSNEDPMVKLMQSLMSGTPPDLNTFNQAGLPPGLAEMLSGAGGMGGGFPGQQEQLPPSISSATWRVVHALVSLVLAVYVTFSSPISFTGSKEDRELGSISSVGSDFGSRLFFWFASVEVVLQSSRFFLERGQLGGTGWLGTLTKILPEPYAGYLRVFGRYGVIFSTVISDALVVVFALGVVAWWNGGTSKAVSIS